MKKILTVIFTVLLITAVSVFSVAAFTGCGDNGDNTYSMPPPKADLIRQVRYGIVEVEHETYVGSGVIVRSDADSTVILTNRHVLGAIHQQARVRFYGENNFYSTVVLGVFPAYDIAVLTVLHSEAQLQPKNIHVFEINRSPAQGEEVLALGFGSWANQNKRVLNAMDGTISAPKVFVRAGGRDVFAIQSTTGFSHGVSGGALIDTRGRLLGITSWGYEIGGSPISNIGYSIPIAIAEAVMDRVLAVSGPVVFSDLGFTVSAQGDIFITQPAWNGFFITSRASGIYQVSIADNSLRRINFVNGIALGNNITILIAEVIRTHDNTVFNFA